MRKVNDLVDDVDEVDAYNGTSRLPVVGEGKFKAAFSHAVFRETEDGDLVEFVFVMINSDTHEQGAAAAVTIWPESGNKKWQRNREKGKMKAIMQAVLGKENIAAEFKEELMEPGGLTGAIVTGVGTGRSYTNKKGEEATAYDYKWFAGDEVSEAKHEKVANWVRGITGALIETAAGGDEEEEEEPPRRKKSKAKASAKKKRRAPTEDESDDDDDDMDDVPF